MFIVGEAVSRRRRSIESESESEDLVGSESSSEERKSMRRGGRW